jgi:hypothetical protein
LRCPCRPTEPGAQDRPSGSAYVSVLPGRHVCMARDQITLDAGTITGRGQGVRDVRAIDGQAMGHAGPACSRRQRIGSAARQPRQMRSSAQAMRALTRYRADPGRRSSNPPALAAAPRGGGWRGVGLGCSVPQSSAMWSGSIHGL